MAPRKIGVNFFNNIQRTLCRHLTWNKARLKCMTSLVQGLIATRSVNLALICSDDDDADSSVESSKYRRFQRFFKDFEMPLQDVAKLIRAKIPRPEEGYTLSMDRTNWQFGSKHINILTVGINVGKVCVPIVWKVLPQGSKSGNSSGAHRREVIERLLEVLPASEIRVLLMDREFLGMRWLQWLDDQSIGYVLRIKRNTIVGNKLAHEHSSARGRKASTRQKIWKQELYFGCKKVKQGRSEHLYVVSNRFEPKQALELYRQRWGIEQLFSHLKQRGFHLEDTHMTDAKKLERLMAMVSISFLFSYGWGLHLRTIEKQTRFVARKSHYRYGLGSILRMLKSPRKHKDLVNVFLEWLDSGELVPIS